MKKTCDVCRYLTFVVDADDDVVRRLSLREDNCMCQDICDVCRADRGVTAFGEL